jgi:hypothetical protein
MTAQRFSAGQALFFAPEPLQGRQQRRAKNVVPDAGQLPGVGIAASEPARHEVLRQNRTRKPAAAQQHGSRFNVRHYTTVM